MKIHYLFLLSSLLAFTACSKDDKDSNPSTGTTLYVNNIINSRDSVVFDYNADKTLSRWATFSSYNTTDIYSSLYFPKYASGKLVSLDFTNYVDGTTELRSLYFPTFNAAGVVDRVYTSSTHAGTYDSLVYNNQGKIIASYTFTNTGDTKAEMKIELTWANNNVTKIVRTDAEGVTYTRTSTYDDKKNIYNASTGLITYIVYYYYYYLSANNITKEVYETSAEEGSFTTTYTYTYNENNYPVTYKSSEIMNDGSANLPATLDSARITYFPVQ